MADTSTRFERDTAGTAGGEQRKHWLASDIEGRDAEALEHALDHLLTVLFPEAHYSLALGRFGDLSEEDWVVSWVEPELILEGVVPDLFHIVPVRDDTARDRVLQDEDTRLGASLITDIGALVLDLLLRATDNGREDRPRGFATSETGLHQSGTIVDNQSLDFVRHCRK